MHDYSEEDTGNIHLLEHVNVRVPEQSLATLFYVVGLGLTRDPYLNVGLENMWVNIGEQQFHLPTGSPQVIHGTVGLVLPNREALVRRLGRIEEQLKGTRFTWSEYPDFIDVTCPWGNRYRCYTNETKRFGDMALGLAYVELLVGAGTAEPAGRFYQKVFGAKCVLDESAESPTARVKIGRNQELIFRESATSPLPYDEHHVAIYVGNFSGPYQFLKERGLVTEDVRNHQFRFQTVVDPATDRKLLDLEHEVRSLQHPMYGRFFVNRDPEQTQRNYRRGRDALIPFKP